MAQENGKFVPHQITPIFNAASGAAEAKRQKPEELNLNLNPPERVPEQAPTTTPAAPALTPRQQVQRRRALQRENGPDRGPGL